MDDSVCNQLEEWDLRELIHTFREQGVDEETLYYLDDQDIDNLIPIVGPREKLKKELELLKTTPQIMAATSHQEENQEMVIDSDQEENQEMVASVITNSEDPIYPGAPVTRRQGLLATILCILHHRLTAAQNSLMALLNFLVPNLLVPDLVESQCLTDNIPKVSTVFCCPSSQNYFGKKHVASCSHCNEVFNDAGNILNGRFFFSVSLKDLLKNILEMHGDKLITKTVKSSDHIRDVMDGSMYQNLIKNGTLAADDITLTWNCDGLNISNNDYSSKYSVWALQFTINELPYELRWENVVVAGLWFGPTPPTINTFLNPFIHECRDLAQNPLQWRDSSGTIRNSKVFSLVCSSDAEARPLLRNCKKFNGEYGCDWCLHPGTMVKKGSGHMRSYTYDERKQAPRSKSMFQEHARQSGNSASSLQTYGVKGGSVLSKLPFFDIVFGFVPEYMHSVLVGVTKQLMSLWLEEGNSEKPWYIGHKVSQMDSRLLSLKPTLELGRRPWSLKCWESWKASQWRAFLLFHSISVLPGILHASFLDHYFHLSFSIHILLQESISQQDLELAHNYLKRFVVKMEELYGEENVTFNCHQLIHLTESVRNWGPLWATSAFRFEINNGNLRSLFKGVDFDYKQIYQRFIFWQYIPRHLDSLVFNEDTDFGELLAKLSPVNEGGGSFKPLGQSYHVDITESFELAIEELLGQPVCIGSLEAFDSFIFRNTVYHSASCKESNQTDCFIKLEDGRYGEIQQLLLFKINCVCTFNCLCQPIQVIMVNLYDTRPDPRFSKVIPANESKNIFIRYEGTSQLKAFYLSSIECKCMRVDGWLVTLPNTCERY